MMTSSGYLEATAFTPSRLCAICILNVASFPRACWGKHTEVVVRWEPDSTLDAYVWGDDESFSGRKAIVRGGRDIGELGSTGLRAMDDKEDLKTTAVPTPSERGKKKRYR